MTRKVDVSLNPNTINQSNELDQCINELHAKESKGGKQ